MPIKRDDINNLEGYGKPRWSNAWLDGDVWEFTPEDWVRYKDIYSFRAAIYIYAKRQDVKIVTNRTKEGNLLVQAQR